MTRLTQLCVFFVTILWCHQVSSSPIFESINIERKLNIDLKPFKFGPITFIKERWGPFGKFIKKHTIERRDLDELNTIDSRDEDIIKPVVEERFIPVIEKEEPIMGPVPEYRLPVPAVVNESNPPPVSKLNTDISGAIPVKTVPEDPVPVNPIPVKPVPINPIVTPLFTPANNPGINRLRDLGAVPIVGSPPIEGPLLVPVTPPAPAVTVPIITPSPSPPPPSVVEVTPRSRFGAFARFFGEILSEIVSRLIARARLSFGQFASQPAAAQ